VFYPPETHLVVIGMTYTGGMLDATEQTIRERVTKLRAELIEISRLNQEYLHISHTLQVKEAHTERRDRLEQIVMELRSLSSFCGAR